MFKKPIKIIGINPGTRYLGVAVFEGPELRDWRIKAIKGKWSKEKLGKAIKIISDFVDRHEANVLAIKRLHPSRSSHNLDQLVDEIKALSKKIGLKVYEYPIDDLNAFFSEKRRTNKQEMAEVIASKYPHLTSELNKEENNKNLYYTRMFEAVALGSICLSQLDKK
jgi:Holliday junction resolvasome RuvABC endonuclease subunit